MGLLLRHRLLRKADGFECLASVGVHAQLAGFRVLNFPDVEDALVNGHAADATKTGTPHEYHDSLIGADELLGLEPAVAEYLSQLSEAAEQVRRQIGATARKLLSGL
jgi:hypothetical protein